MLLEVRMANIPNEKIIFKNVGLNLYPSYKNLITMNWNKLIKCFGIVITAFTFLGCLFVGCLYYPITTSVIILIIAIVALTWVLYANL